MADLSRSKKILFWLITIFFPVLLLVILEAGLRLADYNKQNQEAFIEFAGDKDYLVFNPKFVDRYFPTFRPNTAPNIFKKVKTDSTFRVVVFGGSSAHGYPYNFYHSFAGQLKQKLVLNTDGLNIEVINLGMTAVNSYVIWDLSRRILEYKPDAVIIYAGHNEYYGSFGAATTQFGLVNNVSLKRLVLNLKNFRTFQLLESLLNTENISEGGNRTLMAKVVRDSDIELGSKVYGQGVEQFAENISDVTEMFSKAEIPVYMSTVASNLKDQKPLGDNEESIKAYSKGTEFLNDGDTVSAYREFMVAKESDEIRFRAPEAINDFVRRLTADEENVNLVDIQQVLNSASQSGIGDNSLFTDHLHPTDEGHRIMADTYMNRLLELDPLNKFYNKNSFDIPGTISRFEQTYSNTGMSRLLVGYPFKKGLSVQSELAAFNKIYQEYLEKSFTDSIAAVTARNNAIVPKALTDVINNSKLVDDSVSVMSHYYELLKWQFRSTSLIEKGIEYSVSNRQLDNYLVNIISQALNDGNYDPRYMNVLSTVYLISQDYEKAKYWLDESLRLKSEEPILYYNFARYYIHKRDSAKANQFYKQYLQARN